MKNAFKLILFLAAASFGFAQTKMSDYPADTSPGDNDNVVGYQSPGGAGTTRRFPLVNLKSYFQTGTGTLSTVGVVVPSFLNISGSPVTGAGGSMTIGYSGTPLPVLYGGTGVTSAGLVQGTNIQVSNAWPNQTISATGLLRFDASQSLTSTQQVQARTNLDAIDVTLAVGSTATAAANTSLIQSALNSRGRVFLRGSGTAYINSTLTVNGGNDLEVDPQLTIRSVPAMNTKMLVNAAFLATPASVTISWSSGKSATLTWTASGLAVGDSVWIQGAAQQEYIGVFRVIGITDANTATIDLRLTPTTTATGTITAVKADKDIVVRGGIWNYDYANNTGSGLNNHALVLCGIDRLLVDTTITNAYKYCLCLGAIRDAKVGVVVPATRSDGIKVYGPAFDLEITKVDGNVGDDLISFQPTEATAFLANSCSFGPIVGVRGGNIFCRSQLTGGTGACVFYTNTTYKLQDVDLSGVAGTSTRGGVILTSNSDLTSAQVGIWSNISVVNVSITAPLPWAVKGQVSNTTISGDRLVVGVNEATFNGDTSTNTQSALVWLSDYLVANLVDVQVKTTLASYGNGGGIYAVWNNGHIKNCRVFPYVAANASLRCIKIDSASATHNLDRLEVHSGYANTDHIVTIPAGTLFTNIPEIVLSNLRTDGATGVNSNVAYNLTCANCEFSNMSNGVFRGGGTGITNIRASGNRLLGTSVWLAFPSGTPVVNPLSFDITGDVTLVARNTGNIMSNTNSAAGTLGSAGLVLCQGTSASSWKLISNTALVY